MVYTNLNESVAPILPILCNIEITLNTMRPILVSVGEIFEWMGKLREIDLF